MAGPAHPNAPTIDNHRGLVAYFARNPVASNLVMVILLVGGLLAALGLTAQVFPTIDPGTVTISVAYPGATPSEVEEGITRRVEEAVFGIDGVDRVISRASENLGSVTLELKDFVDTDKVRDDAEASSPQQMTTRGDLNPEQRQNPPPHVSSGSQSPLHAILAPGMMSEPLCIKSCATVRRRPLSSIRLPRLATCKVVGCSRCGSIPPMMTALHAEIAAMHQQRPMVPIGAIQIHMP